MLYPVCPNMFPEESFYLDCIGCQIEKRHNMGCSLEKTEEEGKYIYPKKTPSGASSAILYFSDRFENKTSKEQAEFCEIQELDDNGRMVNIEHCTKDPYKISLKPKNK